MYGGIFLLQPPQTAIQYDMIHLNSSLNTLDEEKPSNAQFSTRAHLTAVQQKNHHLTAVGFFYFQNKQME